MKKLISREGLFLNKLPVGKSFMIAKYLIIKCEGSLLLLISDTQFFKHHAQALEAFMYDNEMDTITIFGGGLFKESKDFDKISFVGISDSYGQPSLLSIIEVLRNIKFPYRTVEIEPNHDKDTVIENGVSYDFEAVTHEVTRLLS